MAGCTSSAPSGSGTSVGRLDQSISGLTTARGAVLRAVESVQAGARALDATDAICAKGHGVAARTSQRAGANAVASANAAVQNLGTLVANYRSALASLDKARTAVSGPPRMALANVVRDGQLEATAVAQFQDVVRTAWQQYTSLDGQEKLWIKRAVTPWYRTDQEAADAYSVLVHPGRRFLEVARTQLQKASEALITPTTVQAATLAAADRALTTLRKRN